MPVCRSVFRLTAACDLPAIGEGVRLGIAADRIVCGNSNISAGICKQMVAGAGTVVHVPRDSDAAVAGKQSCAARCRLKLEAKYGQAALPADRHGMVARGGDDDIRGG